MSYDHDNDTAILVAILFTVGDEVRWSSLCKQLEWTREKIEQLLPDAREKLRKLGLVITASDTALQLAVAPEYGDYVLVWQKKERESPLSPASLETLATICYLKKASKEEIDFIRGVNSYFSLRKLAMLGMVEKNTNDQYAPTVAALGNLGVSSLSELPNWEEVHTSLRNQLHVQREAVVE